MDIISYLFVLGANLSFSTGSIFFTHYARDMSPLFMNCFKSVVALVSFGAYMLFLGDWTIPNLTIIGQFMLSGFLGLNVGDIFLLISFTLIGPGRTLILFGFQPLILGFLSHLFLGQTIDARQSMAIVFFLMCLVTFALEGKANSGRWQVKGIVFALIGMLLDCMGILITRLSFDAVPTMSTFEGNFYRCLGAIAGFILLSFFWPLHFKKFFFASPKKTKLWLIVGSLLGTFISLSFYLQAIRTGHLATITGLSITSPILATLFEKLYFKRETSWYLWIAMIFFIFGFAILVIPHS
jgi:drug/metabolite transporter (DMT)-like permease